MTRSLPVRASVRIAHRIGAKCLVTELGDGWLCSHGTDGTGVPTQDKPEDLPRVGPMGSIGVDHNQARVYYHPGDEAEDPRALVISPDNTPFRTSARGRTDDRSKSFDATGNPVPEVLFLYALKTRRYDDRLRALDSLPLSFWENRIKADQIYRAEEGPSFGQIFNEMRVAALSPPVFDEIVGLNIAQSARNSDGLADWQLWERVAEHAAQNTRERIAKAGGEAPADFDTLFLRAVKETSLEHQGLPAQAHVRERWIELANRGVDSASHVARDPGDWKANRKKLGFDWLPPTVAWKKSWLPLRQSESGRSAHESAHD